MKFTDIFIRRPVLASVVSLLILMFGLRAIVELPIREYPRTESTTITITTSYPGADPELIEGFITQPIQKKVTSADGIDYMTATSIEGLSQINIIVELNYDPQAAFTDIMSKVASVRNELPRESEDPVILSQAVADSPLMYIGFNSTVMNLQQITDYITREVLPKLEVVSGVAQAEISGGREFAMRIWLDPYKMAAYNTSAMEVANALAQNNYQSTSGSTKGEYVSINVLANTDLHDIEEFNNLVIRTENGSPVYMRDIALVELGGESYNSSVTFNGQQGVFVSISVTPQANPLTVISAVKKVVPQITNALPPNLSAEIVYDATDYIRESIYEVFKTIFEATLIVIIVIYLFLGSFRAILIPVITIPLSLIGVCSLMLALGYSINLLTLLAMVLAIGLVVDDAIVVLENIHRHIEDGETPFNAALIGAREITLPVIGMTITLAAVYAPIGFIGGLTGALFKEFAFTLASAVIISGIIALTLSPMMCSKILAPRSKESRVEQWINHFFDRLQLTYQHSLQALLNYRTLVVIFAILVFSSVFFLYSKTPKETAPDEDIGFFIVFGQAPEYASLNYLDAYSNEFDRIFTGYPEAQYYFLINTAGGAVGGNRTIGGIILKPWSQRDRSQKEMNPLLQAQVSEVAGIQSNVVIPSRLPGVGGGAPIQLMITSSGDYETIFQAAQDMVDAALKSGLFIFIKNNLNFERPQIQVNIERNKAADLGITMENIGIALAQNLAEGYVNRFSVDGYSYRVIPQLLRKFRFNEQSLLDIYVKTASEEMVSLATIATVTTQAQPNSRSQFQQLNSAEIIGSMAPGYTIGDAVEFFQKQAAELLPEGVSYDYAGQTRQFVQEGNTLLIAFFFSIILIFLVLAAQYESYRDPFIILISVPMSICGALIPLNLGLATINIYTQVGLITLIGVISKHGILMVDFANSLQRTKGLSKAAAIIEASKIRLRPILMTTAAMVFGVMPLLIATGAGAASRFGIGLVIVSGLSIGTLFTLYVVPVMYTLLAKVHQHESESISEPSIAPEADNPG